MAALSSCSSEDDSILMWREDHLSDPVSLHLSDPVSLPLATSQEELPILPILELNVCHPPCCIGGVTLGH